MEAFEPTPPEWTGSAIHASAFCCPTCKALPVEALRVWVNRRSPVFSQDHRRKWQEFYQCQCETVWWAWSSDRPPNNLTKLDSNELSGNDWDI